MVITDSPKRGQLGQGLGERVHDGFAQQPVFGRVVGGGQHVLQQAGGFGLVGAAGQRGIERDRALGRHPAVAVNDAVARHPKQPGRCLLDGLEQPVALDQLGEDILQDVLGLGRVGHAPLDKAQQAAALLAHGRLNLLVLAGGSHHGRRQGKGKSIHRG